MRLAFSAPALLIAALAGCGTGGSGPDAPQATETATEVAVVPESPATPAAAATADGAASEDACGAGKLDRWLNALPTEGVKAQIAATVGERPIRYYTQGDPITMDFSAARLNVELGADGRIELFRCG